WRHDDLLATARARIDVRAGAKAKVPAPADAHLAQTPAVAGHRNAVAGEARIGVDEGLLDLVRRDREHCAPRDISVRDPHHPARLAHGFEISAGSKPRAGAVAIPFAEDQPRRRHQVEYGGDDIAVEPRGRLLAEFRKAPLVLRPEPMHHERIGPRPALLLRRRAATARSSAERGRQGEREHVETDPPGLIWARIRRPNPTATNEPHRQRGKRHAPDTANHGTHTPLSAGTANDTSQM